MGVVESVKAASDVYAPVSGEIVEVLFALHFSYQFHPFISRDLKGIRYPIRPRKH